MDDVKRKIIATLGGKSPKEMIISALGGTPDGEFQSSEYQALDDIVGFALHENTPPEGPLELIEPTEAFFGLYLRERSGKWGFYLSRQLPLERRGAFTKAAKKYGGDEARIRAGAMVVNSLPVRRNPDGLYFVNNPQLKQKESMELSIIPGWQEGKDSIMEKYRSYFKRS